MKYEVSETAPDSNACAFEPYLFHREYHLKAQLEAEANWLHYLITSEERVLGHLPLAIRDNQAISPLAATFGSLQYADQVDPSGIESFFRFLLQDLRERYAQSLDLEHYPDFYRHDSQIFVAILSGLDFSANGRINHYLDLTSKDKPNANNRRRLRKDAGRFEFRVIPTSEETALQVFHFIRARREEKGYPFSLATEKIRNLVSCCSNDLTLFSLEQAGQTVGSCLALQIDRHTLYTFHYAHHPDAEPLAPTLHLIEQIKRYAIDKGYHYLDLGTSHRADGSYSLTLAEFKEGLGARRGLKYHFHKPIIK